MVPTTPVAEPISTFKAKPQHYLTLDAARGIAAITVMLFHIHKYVYPHVELAIAPQLFAHSYLAVDLFFIMSGLVVSRAYESQLLQGSMTFAAFCITRAVRLLPLYIAGTLLGLCYAFVKSRLGHDAGMDLRAVWPTLLLNVFFIPDLSHSTGPFPFDPAAWSLSLEWSINLVYAAWTLYLSTTCLAVLTCVFAALLAAWGIDFGSLDMGWGTVTAVGGILRVCFSFTLGVIIYRLNMHKLISLPRVDVQVLLVLTMLCLLTPFGKLGVCYELVVVMLVFPLIVAAACFVEPSRSLAPLFHELGRVSYSVYILHTPLILGVFGVWKYVAEADPTLTPTTSCPILLATVLTACYLATAYFDEPCRKWLGTQMQRRGLVPVKTIK